MTKDRDQGRSSVPRRIESALHFGPLCSGGLSTRITPQLSQFALSLSLGRPLPRRIFSFMPIHTPPCAEKHREGEESRARNDYDDDGGGGGKTGRELCSFICLFSFPCFFSSIPYVFLYSRRSDYSPREARGNISRADYTHTSYLYPTEVMEIDLSDFFRAVYGLYHTYTRYEYNRVINKVDTQLSNNFPIFLQ